MNRYFYFFLHVITPILIGVIIYVFFRSGDTLVENLFSFLNPNNIKIENKFIFNLPDFLSAYSVHSAFVLYLKKRDKLLSLYILGLFLLSEILQIIFEFGTFDIYDVLSYIFAIILSSTILKKNVK